MGYNISYQTGNYPINVFTSNPPNGGIAQAGVKYALSGFWATGASFTGGLGISAYELGGYAYVAFYRMYGEAGEYTVAWSTSDSVAVSGVDYTGGSGFLTWANGDMSSKVVKIPLLRTSKTVNQAFTFNCITIYTGHGPFFPAAANKASFFTGGDIYNSGHYSTSFSFPVTIVRPSNGEADFVGPTYQIVRPGGSSTLTVQAQRLYGFRGAVTINYHTTNGTASAGVAYTSTSGTLSWADAEGGIKNITIPILSGGSGSQNFTVTIDTPVGGITIGSTNVTTVTIVASSPTPNPTANGSIPEQLVDEMAPYVGTFQMTPHIIEDQIFAYFRPNQLYSGMLGQKIGTIIGFGPAVGSFGQGPDPSDGSQSLTPLSRLKFQGHVN